jgi:hypothetical protein
MVHREGETTTMRHIFTSLSGAFFLSLSLIATNLTPAAARTRCHYDIACLKAKIANKIAEGDYTSAERLRGGALVRALKVKKETK